MAIFSLYCFSSWSHNLNLTLSSVTIIGAIVTNHEPLAIYLSLWVAHAPGMPGTFSPPPRVSDSDMHHDTCVTHVPGCNAGIANWWFPLKLVAGKTFPAFPAHAQPTILRIWQEAHAMSSSQYKLVTFVCVGALCEDKLIQYNINQNAITAWWHMLPVHTRFNTYIIFIQYQNHKQIQVVACCCQTTYECLNKHWYKRMPN